MARSIGRLAPLVLSLAGAGGCDATHLFGGPPPPPDMALPPGCADLDGDHWNVDDGCANGLPGGDCDDSDPLAYPGAKEICGDHKIQDCSAKVNGVPVPDATCDDDRDGYAILATTGLEGGDCDDANPYINPGAFEIQKTWRGGVEQDQGLDDNCDGRVDEPTPSCDAMLKGSDALTYANAIELCAPWLKSASFNKLVDPKQKRLTDHFGTHWSKQAGESMAYFSTGVAADEATPGYTPVEPGTLFQGTEDNPLPIWSTNVCTGKKQQSSSLSNDLVALTMTVRAPTNAKGFAFYLNFFSAEYPEYVGKVYNDMFVARLGAKGLLASLAPCKTDADCKASYFCAPPATPGDDGKCTPNHLVPPEASCAKDTDCRTGFACDLNAGGICAGNVAIDSNHQPITVNTDALFQVCTSSPICDNGGHRCSQPVSLLDGTGYEVIDMTGVPYGGATGWLLTTAPVQPGELFTLTLFLFDDADHQWDSAVLLDGFQWFFTDTPIGSQIP